MISNQSTTSTSTSSNLQLDQSVVNHLKALVIDGVHKAKSGHPGGAMSSMDFAYMLYSEFLNFDPSDPDWMGRDRFVLSAGHESMLLYSLLHGLGWLEMDELKRFRQLHSKTPGHPENFMTKGVECTTGPLGQGAAMSVGFAIAAKHLGAKLDKNLFSHKVYALLGDGCMQEDVTLGAASLAGHLQLPNLIWYYDKNRQQISGDISRATSDDEVKIFEGFGWSVLSIDGHDHAAIRHALTSTKNATRPTLIVGKTIMAKGSATKEGDHETHGAPLAADERDKTKANFGIPSGQEFYWPDSVANHFQRRFKSLKTLRMEWNKGAEEFKQKSDNNVLWNNYFGVENWQKLTPVHWPEGSSAATRNAFGDVLKQWATDIPKLIGGSADLEPSNMTGPFAKAVGDFQKSNFSGRNLAFGVREFPMSAITNGIALHGGLIPFDATFLSFADYSRPALRLGSIQKCRVIHEFTHDSFYLGEDGPTHQPVEHLMSLRVIPNFYVMRPADALETRLMMEEALKLTYPSAICLSRQKLPMLPMSAEQQQDARKGAWIVKDSDKATMTIFATGSEVSLALSAATLLTEHRVRVVSLPCWELFELQSPDWKKRILGTADHKVSIEAGVTFGWQKFIGDRGLAIGLDRFGDSAPMEALAEEYGFTPKQVVERIRSHRSFL
jgi:transketolase